MSGELFDLNPRPRHDGPDLTESDQRRLGSLQCRVVDLMADGRWRTLRQIADACGGSEASVSGRLRDCRKEKFQAVFGHLEVERRRVSQGTWEYRVLGTTKEMKR